MTFPRFPLTFTLFLAASLCPACGTTDKAAPPAVTSPDEDSGPPPTSAKNFQELMGYDWTIEPGIETYYCLFETLEEDLWVADYRPESPPGTHHVSVGYGDPGPADGTYAYGDDIGNGATCNGLSLGQNLAFGGLVSSGEFVMPEGVAVKIPAGKQMLLSVHVSNTGDRPISGRSGIEVVHADPAMVKNVAELIFINDVFLTVTPGKSTQRGTATLDSDASIFGLLHHMHRTGVRMKTTALPASGDPVVLRDDPYVFEEQSFKMADIKLAPGDRIQVSCDYENPGSETLSFGESTEKAEMCISIMYRYPASAPSFNYPATP